MSDTSVTSTDGRTTWTPVVDANLTALIGVSTGLITGTPAAMAVLRRPPWPITTYESLAARRG